MIHILFQYVGGFVRRGCYKPNGLALGPEMMAFNNRRIGTTAGLIGLCGLLDDVLSRAASINRNCSGSRLIAQTKDI